MTPRTLRDEFMMSKHIGEKVCCVFEGTRFHGEVTKVIFHDTNVWLTPMVMFVIIGGTGDIVGPMRDIVEVREVAMVVEQEGAEVAAHL